MSADLVCYIATFFSTLAYLPQVIKTIKTRQTAGISLPMYSIVLLANILWIIYSLMLNNTAFLISSIIAITLVIPVMLVKIKTSF